MLSDIRMLDVILARLSTTRPLGHHGRSTGNRHQPGGTTLRSTLTVRVQNDLVCAPHLLSAAGPMAAPNGGLVRVVEEIASPPIRHTDNAALFGLA